MSSYIFFYIKNNDVYIPIGTYGRSSAIYSFFKCGWQKLIKLDGAALKEIRYNLKEKYSEYKTALNNSEKQIEFIRTANNTMDEKMEWLNELHTEIEDIKEIISELDYAVHFCDFLNNILDEFDDEYYPNNSIYYGVEVFNPNKEDNNE